MSNTAPNGLDAAANPFGPAIQSVCRQMSSQKWQMPYVHKVIVSAIFLSSIAILALLYPTIGICFQLVHLFLGLINQNTAQMKQLPPIEQVGHIIAIGVYGVFLVLFGLLVMPFYFIGWAYG